MQALSPIRIATRQSPLAMWQADFTKQQLLYHWPHYPIEIIPMKTTGDKFLNTKLLDIGGKRLFVKELEEALLENKADIAVHSMKDVPSILPDGLILNTIFARQNPLDALVSNAYDTLKHLPEGAILGTSSIRRAAQIKAHRPDLKIKAIRGNVGTRLKKLDDNQFDAILLAAAGLERLNLQDRIAMLIPDEIICPAAGQGALGIECRLHDEVTQSLIAPLHDALTADCVEVERGINIKLGGSCHTPVAVYCKSHHNHKTLSVKALVAQPDGSRIISTSGQHLTQNKEKLVQDVVQELTKLGVFELIDEISNS